MSDKIQLSTNTPPETDGESLSASVWGNTGDRKSVSTYSPSADDLDSFCSRRWFQSNFSRDEIDSVAKDSKSANGERRLAEYLSSNFDDVQKLTSAGKEGHIHVQDIKMAIDLSSVKKDVQSIIAAKEQLLSKFDRIDANGDRVLSKGEMQNAISPGTDETLNKGMSALIERRSAFPSTALFSSEVSRVDIAKFDEQYGFDLLARPEHYSRTKYLETQHYKALGLVAGAVLACSPLYRGTSLGVRLLAVGVGASLGGWLALDSKGIENHYNNSMAPAAKKLFGM